MKLEEAIRETIVKVGQRNPGAMKVLSALLEAYPGDFCARLFIALELTQTKPSNLWVVFKDLCKYDLEATKVMLEDWFDHSSVSLGHWLRAVKGIEYAEVPE
jgi:hypothetical protein